MQILLAQTNFY